MDARSVEDIVKDLTPLQRARVAEQLFDVVFAHVPVDAVFKNAGDIRGRITADVEKHFAVAQDDVVQQLLLAFAQQSSLEPVLREAVAVVTGAGTLSIRSLLTAGMMVNLILFTATTEVKIKNDSHGHVIWSIDKKPASPELITQILEPFKVAKR